MSKRKENSMTCFLGGTAVGIAAGLLVGKLLSKSTTKIQSFEPGIATKESGNVKYSQDDNFLNPYFHKNIHCHTRSRSAPRYENKSRTEQPVAVTSLTKLNNDFKGNINYDDPEEKCANVQKISCNNNQLHDMSMENNAGYNWSAEVFPDRKEEEFNNSHISNTQNAGRKPSCVTRSNSPGSINTEHKDPSKIINTECVNSSNVKDAKSCSSVEVPETSNDLSSDSHGDDSFVRRSNIQNANGSTRSNILQSTSYRAACNNISNYEEEERISRSSSSEEFYEADLISSTRENNLGVI